MNIFEMHDVDAYKESWWKGCKVANGWKLRVGPTNGLVDGNVGLLATAGHELVGATEGKVPG